MDSTFAAILGLLLLGSLGDGAAQRRRVRGGSSSGTVDFDCPEEFGYYPHPKDCTQYYVCVFGGALLESCTGGLMYSHELQTCDWPRNVGCGGQTEARVSEPRSRAETKQSSRSSTASLTTRDQEQQRRQQQEYAKQLLYVEDRRVTPESAAVEDEGPEGGERQQRVYRGQPSTLAPLSRHTVTNSIPASSIGGSRSISGDKQVTYSLVQPLQQQGQQQQQQIYRYPTGGRLHTAPRPSSYPLQWPPTPQTPSPLLRPPPSAPPPPLSQSADRQPTFLPRPQPIVSTERPQVLSFTPSAQIRPFTVTNSNSKKPDVSGNNFEGANRQVENIQANRNQQQVTEFNRGNAFNNWVNPIRIQIPIPNTNSAAPGKVILTPTHDSSFPIPNRNTGDSGKLILTSAGEPSIPVTISNTAAGKFILTSSGQSSTPLPNDQVGKLILTSSSQPSNLDPNSNSGSTKLFHASGQPSISQQNLNADAGKFFLTSAGHSSIPIPNTNTAEGKLILTSSGRPSIPNTNGRHEKANEQPTTIRPSFSQSILQRPQKGIDAEEEERQPNPFYGEHRFGSLLQDESEEVSFDFDSFLDELKEATSDEGLEPPYEDDDLSNKSAYQEEGLIKPLQGKDTEEETTEKSKIGSKGRQEELGKVIKGHYILRENETRTEPTLAVTRRPSAQKEEGELLETSITLPKTTTMPTPTPTTPRPTPLRPTQRTRLRITTTTTKDFLDTKDDASVDDASYKAEAVRHRRPQQRPVDTSAYADVEVAVNSRPSTVPRARLVSTPATYNVSSTVYTTAAPTAVEPQYDPNYYALYDEDEVELYRDVDYSQVSSGKTAAIGNDNYRGQSHYKVQQVQAQPEVIQQQSYLTRGNGNSYVNAQNQQQSQQPQQTYLQESDIAYGGAALESPDYNDNYNTQEVNQQVQYNPASQQQVSTPLNRNRQRVQSAVVNRDQDRAQPNPTPTTRQPTPSPTPYPRRGTQRQPSPRVEEVRLSSARTEQSSSRRGSQTFRVTPQPTQSVAEPSPIRTLSSSLSSDQPLSINSIEPFDYPNPTQTRGSIQREPAYSNASAIQRPSSVLPKEKPNVRIRPTTASPDSQTTTVSPSRGTASSANRGRGNSAYSSGSSSGRSRPTLKPSTAIVSKAAEFIDIYRFPASRPEPIYPQPRVDQSAAKCRKDICLLPDCSCGGKDVPGGIDPQNVPQIVLLTFDDSVNDLNKQLYSDLFEKGRTNPNGCPISATFYVSHEWTDYSQVQNLYAAGHEMASHSISHSFGEQFSQRKWAREINGQREILAAYGGVKLEDIRGMRAPFLAVGGNKMFKMLYDTNFTYDSSMPVYENRPPSWPYTFDYKIFHDCMIPPCPTRSYPGVWEVPMVMWQDLNGGRCSMGDACSNPPTSDGVYKMLIKNFERHYTTNRAPFGLFYHAAWFTQPHHKEGFEAFLDTIVAMDDVWLVTNWQAIQWMRDPTPLSHIKQFKPFGCDYPDRPRKCNNPKVCNLWHKSGVRYMRTCQPCPEVYPWTGKTGVRNSRVDNEVED